jgi:hypothetical protein
MLHTLLEAMKDLIDPLHRGGYRLYIVSVDIEPLSKCRRGDLDMCNRGQGIPEDKRLVGTEAA